jgi:hypothetical protein
MSLTLAKSTRVSLKALLETSPKVIVLSSIPFSPWFSPDILKPSPLERKGEVGHFKKRYLQKPLWLT